MPYPVADGSILEVTIQGRHNDQTVLSLFHYRLVGSLGLPDGEAAIDTFDAEFQAAGGIADQYVACCSNEYLSTRIHYQWIYNLRYHKKDFAGRNGDGKIAVPAHPQNVGSAITKWNNRASRHSRGTLHMPAVPQTFTTAGRLNGVGLLTYQTLATLLNQTLVTGTMEPVLLNKANPSLSLLIDGATVEETSRINRRRTVGLGI